MRGLKNSKMEFALTTQKYNFPRELYILGMTKKKPGNDGIKMYN